MTDIMPIVGFVAFGIACFMLGVVAAFQVSIVKNSAQMRRNSETIRQNCEIARHLKLGKS